MKNYKYILLFATLYLGAACTDLVDDVNDDLTELSADVIPPEKFLTGAQLANVLAQVGHANRISGLYTGQLTGFAAQYKNIYDYTLTSEETESTWNRIYQGVVPQTRLIISKLEGENALLHGICQVMEAHVIGTAATLFGDIPYEEIFIEGLEDPKFDEQATVLANVQLLLDEAIDNLNVAATGVISEDIYYNGDKQKWLEAAWSLKARYYMQTKEYSSAYSAAQNGISTASNNMNFIPIGDSSITGSKNTYFTLLNGSRAGDIGTQGSYFSGLLDPSGTTSRNHAKTDETARFEYMTVDQTDGVSNRGVASEFEPQRMVTYEETMLALAEAGARTVDFNTGLGHLNTYRQFLNTGAFLNVHFNARPYTYSDYIEADFQAGGLENADNIAQDRALLREIIEERYVSGFMTYMPFDDARRLRSASESDIAVSIPFNTSTATAHPERLVYPDNEINTNANIPSPLPDLYTVTDINQ
ncbi:SusD/RagB family nutrient-binding outer membrane lipoprotein [Reichenbachiella sp.]|uniref:SusD/RagB family nutrient-binding outer membrane lipoprotein n=2 Tax=Reichenbachiella sp. TaxID=2184521 RepID=UPI0032968FF5